MDQKCLYIPYPKWQCVAILLIYELYTHITGIFALFLLFSQIDFLIIRATADLIVNFFSTLWFLSHKRYDKAKYDAMTKVDDAGDPTAHEGTELLQKGGDDDCRDSA